MTHQPYEPDEEIIEESFGDDDDDDEYEFDCGFYPGAGTCSKAGSEECDWDCPYRQQYIG